MLSKFKISTLILSAVLTGFTLAGTYSGGTGEPNNPYLIATAADMNAIGTNPTDWNKHFKMIDDINMASYSYTKALIAPDTSSNNGFQGTKFTGVFDGNNHIIFSLEVNDLGAGNDYIGLFGYVGINGQVLNLAVEDVNIKGDDNVSGLIGWSDLGTVSNSYSTGSISGGDYVSGVVGYNHGTTINCYSNCLVSGTGDYIGGLIGWNHVGIVYYCYSINSASGGGYVGGLIGKNNSGTVSNCYSTGIVNGSYAVGGVMGMNTGIVSSCYSTGSINGDYKVGGLVGDNEGISSSISNCYSTGSVSGTSEKIGGLVGANYAPITNCYSTGLVSGTSVVGGLVGANYGPLSSCYFLDTAGPDNGLGEPLTDSQLKQQASFVDWDFINIWGIGENQTYPYLRIYPAGDLNNDDIVNFADFAILADHWLAGF